MKKALIAIACLPALYAIAMIAMVVAAIIEIEGRKSELYNTRANLRSQSSRAA